MTEQFNQLPTKSIGITAKAIATPAQKMFILSCNVANTTAYELPISIILRRNSVDYFIIKNHRVPTGSNAEVIRGEKIALEVGDILLAQTVVDDAFDACATVITGIP